MKQRLLGPLKEIVGTMLWDYRGKYHKSIIECELECGHFVYRVDHKRLVPGNKCKCGTCKAELSE